MPMNADTRIVQMEFDNANFERNISKSGQSLEQFKQSLDFSSCEDSLNDFSKATERLTFKDMADNLQKLVNKFTGLGTVSEYVASQIRRSFERAAGQVQGFFNSMTTEQVNAGMDKFGQLTKNVQTIMAATGKSEEDVYRVLERLNQYTDQTSYNFTDMAANIGKFTSVGIPLEQAEKQMEGIANWAARSGGGISEASRAMYNLSQAMGVGALTVADWRSIEGASMGTKEFKEQLIQAGIEMGNLEKKTRKNASGAMETYYQTAKKFGKQVEVNYQNLRDTLSKRWADKDVMQRAFMSYYYDNLYYDDELETRVKVTQAQQDALKKAFDNDIQIDKDDWSSLSAQKMATDEIKQAAMDAAVAQGNLVKETDKSGKTVYKTAARYGKQVEVTLSKFEESLKVPWLDKTVAKNVWAFDDLAKAAYESAQKCMTFTDVINAWKDQLSTGWMNSYRIIFGDLSEAMELFSNICNKVANALDNLLSFRNKVLEYWAGSDGSGRTNLWRLIVGEVLDEGEVVAYEGAYGFLDVLGSIGEMIRKGFIHMLKIFARGDQAGLLNDPEWAEAYIGVTLNKVVESIQNFINAMRDFFNATSEGSDKTRWQQIQDVVNAIFAAFLIAYTVIRDISEFIGKLFDQDRLGKSIDAILKLFSALGLGISDAAEAANSGDGLKKTFDDLLIALDPLIQAINALVESITGGLISALNKGEKAGTFAGIWQTISDIFVLLGKVISKVAPPFLNFIKEILGIIVELFDGNLNEDTIHKLGSRLENAINTLLKDLFDLIPGFGNKIQEFLAYIFGFSEDYATDEVDESSKTLLGVAKKWLRKIFGGMATTFDSFKKDADQFNMFTWVKEIIGLDNFSVFIDHFARFVKGTNLYGIVTAFLGGYSLFKLVKVLGSANYVLENFKGFMTGLSDTLKDGVKLKFGDRLESAGEKFYNIAKGIALIVASIAILGSMNPTSLLIGFGAVTLVLTLIAVFVDHINNHVLKDYKKTLSLVGMISQVSGAIIGFTVGLAVLIAVTKTLASLDIYQIISMLTGFAGIILVLGMFAKYVKDVKVKGVGSITLLAIAIAILIKSLRPLADMQLQQLSTMGTALFGILTILAIFTKYVKDVKIKGIASVLVLALSVAILVAALKPLADMQMPQITNMLTGLAGILTMLGLFATYVKSSMKGSGMGSMILLAVSVMILIQSLLPIANFNLPQLLSMVLTLGAIIGILGVFINTTDSMKDSGMLQLVALALSIDILIKAISALAKFELPDLVKMVVGLAAITFILSKATKNIEKSSISESVSTLVTLIGLSVFIKAFGKSMAALKDVEWDTMAAACLGLFFIMTTFGSMYHKFLKDSDILEATNTIILMAGLVAVMVMFSFSINEIRNVPTDKILGFSLGLAALIIAMSKALSATKDIKLGAGLKGILLIAVAVAAVLGVVALMAPLVAAGIGNGIDVLAQYIERICAKLSLAAGMIADFVGGTKSFSEEDIDEIKRKFKLLFELIESVKDSGSYIESSRKFSECLLALGTGLNQFQFSTSSVKSIEGSAAIKTIEKILSYKDQFIAFTGAKNFATQVVYLGAGILVFDTITKDITSVNETPFTLLDRLMKYQDLSTALKDAYTAANRMNSLSGGLSSFVSNTSSITDDNPKALSLLTKMADNADNLQTLTTLSLDGFADQMSALGGGLAIYALGVKEASGIEIGDMPDVSGAIAILQSLTTGITDEMGNITIPEMPDESTLTGFGTQLAALAGGLIKFANASQGLGAGTDKALEVLGFMRDLKTDLTEDNVKIAKTFQNAGLEGSATLTQFGTDISALGGSLKSYSKKTKDFQKNQAALDALSFMRDLKEDLTDSNLKVVNAFKDSGLEGSATLTQFGTDIAALGGSLKTYSESTSGFQKNKAALDALDFFYELQEKLRGHTVESVIFEFFTKNNITKDALQQFGLDIGELGNALAGFAANVNFTKDGDAKALDFQKALDSLDVIQKLAVQLPTYGGIHQLWDGEILRISSLAEDIRTLGEALGQISDELSAVGQKSGQSYNVDLVKGALEAVKLVVEMAAMLQQVDNPDSPMNGIHYAKVLTEMFDNLLWTDAFNGTGADTFINSIVGFMKKFQDAADEVGGIKDSTLFAAFGHLAEGIYDMTNQSKNFDFVPIGENISRGIATGIARGEAGVVENLVKVALAAYKAGKEALDINSPSKVFMELGSGISEGMAVGISDNAGMVKDATEDAALSGFNPATNLIAMFNDLFNSDFDTQPTISPILDLSDVESKSGELDRLFSRDSVASINASVQSSSDKAREAYQNGINSNIRDTMQASVANMQNAVISSQNKMISAMSSELAGIRSQIGNIRIVLNTGVIAGGVTDGVDKGIGRNMLYASRRN